MYTLNAHTSDFHRRFGVVYGDASDCKLGRKHPEDWAAFLADKIAWPEAKNI
jgi:hypothetical protein